MPAAKKQVATTEAAPSLGAAILAGPGVGAEEVTADVSDFVEEAEPVTLADAVETAVAPAAAVHGDAEAAIDAMIAAAPSDPRIGSATAYPAPRPKAKVEAAPAPATRGAIALQTVNVKIVRDLSTSFEVRVYKHEVPALAVVHGLDNIANFEELEDTEETVYLDRFSPVDEFLRLKQRYDRRNMEVIQQAYPAGPVTIAQLAGVEIEPMRKAQVKASAQHIRSREGQVRKQRS